MFESMTPAIAKFELAFSFNKMIKKFFFFVHLNLARNKMQTAFCSVKEAGRQS